MKVSQAAIDNAKRESVDSNPYAVTSQHAHPFGSDVELIRHSHLKLETAIHWIGAIYLLIGCFGMLLAITAVANSLLLFSYGSRRASVEAEIVALVSFLAAAFSCIFIATTLGLRKFKIWARGASIMLAVVMGLFLFPSGHWCAHFSCMFCSTRKRLISSVKSIKR